jgi:hypothetical protein
MMRYIQTCVSQETYKKIVRQAFEDGVSLGEFLELAAIFFIDTRKSRKEVESLTQRVVDKT